MTWTQRVSPFVFFDHLALIGHHYTINGVTHTLIWEIRESFLFTLLIVPICRWGVKGGFAAGSVLLAVIVSMQMLGGNIDQIGNLRALNDNSS